MANTEDAIAVLPPPYVTAAGLQDDTLRCLLYTSELKHLSKTFQLKDGAVNALKDINLTIQDGCLLYTSSRR